jgi:uncharacterized protein (DUF983 family)
MNSLSAVWRGKCPRCKKGDIFHYPLTRISKFSEMNSHCPQCQVSFTPEPGFYFGALFISYAFNVAIMVTISILLYFFIHPPDWVYGASLVTVSIIFIPFSFRYSRILFLYGFGGLQSR